MWMLRGEEASATMLAFVLELLALRKQQLVLIKSSIFLFFDFVWLIQFLILFSPTIPPFKQF